MQTHNTFIQYRDRQSEDENVEPRTRMVSKRTQHTQVPYHALGAGRDHRQPRGGEYHARHYPQARRFSDRSEELAAEESESAEDNRRSKRSHQVHQRTRGGAVRAGHQRNQRDTYYQQHDYSSEDYYQQGYFEKPQRGHQQPKNVYYEVQPQRGYQSAQHRQRESQHRPKNQEQQQRGYASKRPYYEDETKSEEEEETKEHIYHSTTLTKKSRVLRRGKRSRMEEDEEVEGMSQNSPEKQTRQTSQE